MSDGRLEHAAAVYRERFGDPPRCVSWAPGRMEILGNHTDYNGGFVLSVALGVGIAAAAGPAPARSAERIELWSEEFQTRADVALDPIEPVENSWINYPLGVVRELRRASVEVGGFRMAFASDLPLGAGVSSSAAIELATAEALHALFGGRPDDPMEVARLCQRAEVDFVGVPCGLLDQFSSLFGRENHVLFLDCRTLEYAQLKLARDDLCLVVADTGVQHALVDGQYAKLRSHCENAVAELKARTGRDIAALRDVTIEEFAALAGDLDPDDRRRAEHVIRENRRVLEGRAAVETGDLLALGSLMAESHESSRDLLGNSCAELDFLVEQARSLPGFLGGKLSGGGFGGSTVHLVELAAAEEFGARLEEAYSARFDTRLRWITTSIGRGAFACQFAPETRHRG